MKTLNNEQERKQRALRARRITIGITIDELGRRSGLERSRVSRAERGYAVLRDDEIARLHVELDKVGT